MNTLTRRSFLKSGAAGAGAWLAHSHFAPLFARTPDRLVFRPYLPQGMPELAWAYASDVNVDPFKSAISVERDGIVVPDSVAQKFAVNARWFVPGFGFVWLAADNGGEFYTLGAGTSNVDLNLNLEFARSRVARNREVRARYEKDGTRFSQEVMRLAALSEELLSDAQKKAGDGEKCAALADRSLFHAMWVGESIELEKARADILQRPRNETVYFGCESRQMIWAKSVDWQLRFPELFNFATITHYNYDTWYEPFEPSEGRYNWGVKDDILNFLEEQGITPQGRPLFWFSKSVTPDWLREKNFDQLKKYVVRHTHDLVSHYGDRVLQWEVVNEYHDWANIHNHTPEQITDIVRLACDTTKQVNPKVVRILNNCYPFGEYVARGRMGRTDATRPLRTVRKYLQDLLDAGVEFDVVGIQIYFPQRDLSDIARLLERLSQFKKPIYITEIGASSNLHAPNPSGARNQTEDEPYAWHREWDEDLQADWLEQVYTIYYSKHNIKAINWYDFSDFRPFIVNGGLVREDCSPKKSFFRLKNLLASWNRLPKGKVSKP
jgi:endo-1,4-beta-xylanase